MLGRVSVVCLFVYMAVCVCVLCGTDAKTSLQNSGLAVERSAEEMGIFWANNNVYGECIYCSIYEVLLKDTRFDRASR